VPDVPAGEGDENEKGSERDCDFLHGCELGLAGSSFILKRGRSADRDLLCVVVGRVGAASRQRC
jgi:hypothetical protein